MKLTKEQIAEILYKSCEENDTDIGSINFDAILDGLNKHLNEYLDQSLPIDSVVSSKITVSVTYLKWHYGGHALLDDYSTKETKIVKVNDVEEVKDMFTNVIKIKVVK